jgi:hypothetical protein
VRFVVQAENDAAIRRRATVNFELGRGCGGTAAPELLNTGSHFGQRRSENGPRWSEARTLCTDRGQEVLTRDSCLISLEGRR